MTAIDTQISRNLTLTDEFHGSLITLDKVRQVGRGLRHWTAILTTILSQGVKPVEDIVEMHQGHLELIALIGLACYRGCIFLPQYLVSSSLQRVLLESTEIVGSLHIALALGSLEIDVESAIVHLISHGTLHALLGNDRIILWSPRHQVLGISHGKLRRMVVDTPKCSPSAILRLDHARIVHFLLRSPRTVVGGAELTYIHPLIAIREISEMQPLVRCW